MLFLKKDENAIKDNCSWNMLEFCVTSQNSWALKRDLALAEAAFLVSSSEQRFIEIGLDICWCRRSSFQLRQQQPACY